MKKQKVFGSVKRFGPRYGRTTRHKLAAIEKDQKKAQKCPYCKKNQAKRLAMGLYKCGKCGAKFTGGAYFVQTKETVAGISVGHIAREVKIKTRAKEEE